MTWEISNNIGEYLNSCRDAALDNRYFNQFKQDPRYRQILEHVSFEEASQYASQLPVKSVLESLDRFKENDKYIKRLDKELEIISVFISCQS